MTTDSPSMQRQQKRLPIAFRRLLRFGIFAFALYLLAGNVFLNTPLANHAFNRTPERFHISWSAALTPWPGVIFAWNVETGGHTRNIQWQASAELATTRIALRPLLQRELRLPSIDAHQVTFAAERVDAFIPPREPSPRAWTVALPKIQTDTLLEARWSSLRLLGFGQATLGIIKQLRGGPLEIRPSRLAMRNARLTHDKTELLNDATINVEFSIDRHTSDEYLGLQKLAITKVALELDAAMDTLDITLDEGKPMDLQSRESTGRVKSNLVYSRGELLSGGSALIQIPLTIAMDGGERLENTLTLKLDVGEGIDIDVQLPEQLGGSARLDANLHVARRDLPFSDIKALLPDTSGRIALRWRFDSLGWLSALLVKKAWFTFDGAGELDAELTIESGLLVAGSRFTLPAVQLRADVLNDRITGSGRADGHIYTDDASKPSARVDVALDAFKVAPQESPQEPYVEGKQLTLEMRSSGDLAEFRDTVTARGRFTDAQVPDLTLFNTYLPKRDMRFTQGRGTLSGDLTIDAEGEVTNGSLDIRANGAGMHLGRIDVTGNVDIKTRLTRGDLKQRNLRLDGTSMGFSRIAFRDASGNSQRDWWASVMLTSANATWGRPMAVDADATVAVKNVSFLLAVFSQKKKFPRWVARAVDAGEAQASGKLELRSGSLVVDQLVAENDRFALRSRLKLADSKASGDLLLSWGVLSMGVELDESERDYHLVAAKRWFDGRPNLLPGTAKQ